VQFDFDDLLVVHKINNNVWRVRSTAHQNINNIQQYSCPKKIFTQSALPTVVNICVNVYSVYLSNTAPAQFTIRPAQKAESSVESKKQINQSLLRIFGIK